LPDVLSGKEVTRGISRKGFDFDLTEAKYNEGKLAKVLSYGLIELKTEYKGLETGNFFLEYESHGKPSGIATTDSQYWIIELPRRCYVVIEAERLRKLGRIAFKENRKLGGDFNTSRGVTIPLTWLVYGHKAETQNE